MSDLDKDTILVSLKLGCDVKLNRTQARELADLIEQQQREIEEASRSLQDEQIRVCELETRNHELAAHVEQVNKNVSAYLEIAEDDEFDYEDKATLRDNACEALDSAPQISLAKHDREVKERNFKDGFWRGFEIARMNPDCHDIQKHYQHANKIGNGKGGE